MKKEALAGQLNSMTLRIIKIANNIGDIQCSLVFNRDRNINAQTRNQRDPLNLVKNHTNLEIRRNFFCERVVDTWNHIPSEIKQSENVKIFKRSLESDG